MSRATKPYKAVVGGALAATAAVLGALKVAAESHGISLAEALSAAQLGVESLVVTFAGVYATTNPLKRPTPNSDDQEN